MMGCNGRLVILEASLFCLIISAPIFFGSVPNTACFSLCAGLFFLLFIFPEALFEIRRLPQPFVVGLFSVMGFVMLQALGLSVIPQVTREELLKWLAFLSCFLLVQLLPTASVRRLMKIFTAVAVLESIYGLWQLTLESEKVLWRIKEVHQGYFTGTYINRNHAAGFLELALSVHLGFVLQAFKEKKTGSLIFLLVLFFLPLAAFYKTGSRMGIGSFGAAFLLMSCFLVKRTGKRSLFFFLAAGLVFFAFSRLFAGALEARWLIISGNFENWHGGRLWAWADVLRMIRHYWKAGVGLGGFEWVFPNYQSEKLTLGWEHAHQDYLELVAELGIPFAVILFFSFGYLGLQILLRQKKYDSPLVWGICLGLLSLIFHGGADFNFAVPANAFLFVLLAAAAYRLTQVEKQAKVSI